MLTKLYKQYLSRFPLARRLRWMAGKTVWAVRWKLIYPAKLACVKCLRKLRNISRDCIFWTVDRIVRPLARRFIPRHTRTKLLSYNWRKVFGFLLTTRELPLIAFGNAAVAGRVQPGAEIFLKENVACSAPEVFPVSLAPIVNLPTESYSFPAVRVTEVTNAKVEGLSNFVESTGEVLHHDLYRLVYDYTSEELHGRVTIYPAKNRIRKFGKNDADVTLEAAAVFTDACSPNYAHWLTEVLPRIHACAQSDMDESIPFIVDAGLHANILASARLLAGNHPLMELAKGQIIQVARLYVVGATGYIPFDRRPTEDGNHSHGIFSPSALKSMRAKLSELLGNAEEKYPRRIMLRRSSGARAMRNEEVLAAKLDELGFASIYPEKLTFAQQYHLFSNAECVVGATGAAMANLVFCKPSCRVVICLSSHREHSFGYWRNMASAMGNEIRYVLGPVMGEKNQGVHADFMVSVDDVIVAINH